VGHRRGEDREQRHRLVSTFYGLGKSIRRGAEEEKKKGRVLKKRSRGFKTTHPNAMGALQQDEQPVRGAKPTTFFRNKSRGQRGKVRGNVRRPEGKIRMCCGKTSYCEDDEAQKKPSVMSKSHQVKDIGLLTRLREDL